MNFRPFLILLLALLVPLAKADQQSDEAQKAFAKELLKALLEDAREKGYAFWPALISEALVVAVPILDGEGRPVGALSCAAIKERLDPKRRVKVVTLLKAEATRIQLRLSGTKTVHHRIAEQSGVRK